MLEIGRTNLRGLLAILSVSCAGCAAQWCRLPDDCAYAFHHTQLGWELDDICNHCPLDGIGCSDVRSCGDPLGCAAGIDCSCGDHVDDEAVWMDASGPEPVRRRPRIAVGPPPNPYQPPMPPKFLPVPARSVFTAVNQAAPTLEYQPVEVGYGHELAFP